MVMRDIKQAFTTFRIIRPASAVRFTHPVIYQTVPVDTHSSESESEKLYYMLVAMGMNEFIKVSPLCVQRGGTKT